VRLRLALALRIAQWGRPADLCTSCFSSAGWPRARRRLARPLYPPQVRAASRDLSSVLPGVGVIFQSKQSVPACDGRTARRAGCFNGAHTYCLGLGALPEGDWFCDACTTEGWLPPTPPDSPASTPAGSGASPGADDSPIPAGPPPRRRRRRLVRAARAGGATSPAGGGSPEEDARAREPRAPPALRSAADDQQRRAGAGGDSGRFAHFAAHRWAPSRRCALVTTRKTGAADRVAGGVPQPACICSCVFLIGGYHVLGHDIMLGTRATMDRNRTGARFLMKTLSIVLPTSRHARQARGGAGRRSARAARRARARHGRAAAGRAGRAGRRAHRRPACQPRPGVRAAPGVPRAVLMRFPGSLCTCNLRVAGVPTPVRACSTGGLCRSSRPERRAGPCLLLQHAMSCLCHCRECVCTHGEHAVSLTSTTRASPALHA